MLNLNSVINNLEKIATFRFFFLFSSFVMTFEMVTIFFLHTSIAKIDLNMIKNEIGYILISIALFSLLANVIPPILSLLIGFMCKKREIIQFEKDNYVDKDDLLVKALKSQNSIDYQYLQSHKEEEQNLQKLKNYSLLFSFTLTGSYFFPNSIIHNLEIYLNTNYIITIVFAFLGLALFLFIQMVLCDFTDKIYYPQKAREENSPLLPD